MTTILLCFLPKLCSLVICFVGAQLLEDYGDNSDDIYVQYHGFVVPWVNQSVPG